jgi:cyclophilin family peptidyl-prolyl cis-trans isomerase
MLWLSNRGKRKSSPKNTDLRPSQAPAEMFERLEERIVFYAGPMLVGMPPHASLENVFASVVRMNTNMGNIDIELYDGTAPNTVNNFKRYIAAGRLDETIFHRSEPGFVLQGGGFKFQNGVGATPVQTYAPVNNEFSRLNLARTISMAKLPGDPNSATSQFFINLVNNPNLDTQNGGFTVFGKVVRGWNIVEAIAGLQTRNLNQQLNGTVVGPFDNVPTRPNYDPVAGPSEASLVRIIDIELIKTAGSARYYIHTTHIPEGFRGAQVVERIDLQNMDRDIFNFYQVLVRYETGERDQVITSGVLQAGERRSFKISDFNFPNYNIVRANVPYSIEVRSSRAMAASLNHRDFGITLDESLTAILNIRQAELQKWNIPGGEKGTGFQSYITYQNLTPNYVTLNMAVHSEDGTTRFIQRVLKPYRRGGLEVHNIGVVPNGRFNVQINASGPIVAGISQYKIGTTGATTNASTSTGAINTGSTLGVVAGAIIPSQGQSFVDLYYTAPAPGAIFVDLEYILSNGQTLTSLPVLLTTGQRSARVDLALANPSIPKDQFFTIRYTARGQAAPVAARFTSRQGGDEMSLAFQTASTRTMAFADGFTDPTIVGTGGMRETISVFNPYVETNVLFFYQLVFQFSDGSLIWAPLQGLSASARRDHVAYDIPDVKAKIDSNPAFRFYSVQVISSQLVTPLVNGAVVAQLTRTHNTWNQNLATLPALDPRMTISWLNEPDFLPS